MLRVTTSVCPRPAGGTQLLSRREVCVVLGYLAPEGLSDGGLVPRGGCLRARGELWWSLPRTGVRGLAADGRIGGVTLTIP